MSHKTTITLHNPNGVYTLEDVKALIERAENAGAEYLAKVESFINSIEITIEVELDDE